MLAARYLAGYPLELIAQAEQLRLDGRLADHLARRLPERHEVRSDAALFDYVQVFKARHLRNAGPLNYVGFDAKLRVLQQAWAPTPGAPRSRCAAEDAARDPRGHAVPGGARRAAAHDRRA